MVAGVNKFVFLPQAQFEHHEMTSGLWIRQLDNDTRY